MSLSPLRILGYGLLSMSMFLASFRAQAKSLDLGFQFNYQLKANDLTTEKLGELDSQLVNPHLQTWALSRQAALFGLTTVRNSDGTFRVQAHEVIARAEGHIRPSGPWYRPWREFNCQKEPNRSFVVQEGAERAASWAAEFWSTLLKQRKPQLEVILSQVRARTQSLALDRAEQVFRGWLRSSEKVWYQQSSILTRQEEWRSYLELARSSGFCAQQSSQAPLKATLMEPVTSAVNRYHIGPPELLARAPARLWNGLFSVRLNLGFAGKTLNGRFLIDSNAPMSVISPSWLENQGIYSQLITVADAPLEVPSWSRSLKGEKPALSRRVQADSVEISGLLLPLREFLLAETEFFSPPESLGSCCDGILGLDFLRLYPIEFQSEAPAEVRVRPRAGFSAWAGVPFFQDAFWTEVSQTPASELVSECPVSVGTSGKVSWDLGSQVSVQQSGRGAHMTLGMPILSQGPFILDLPHGRIWFSKKSSIFRESKKNRSGLHLDYVMEDRERTLKVKSIDPQSPAQALLKVGLRAGMVITQLDSKPAEEMDLWEVERRLSGAFGDSVMIQWDQSPGVKMALLRLAQKLSPAPTDSQLSELSQSACFQRK